MNRLTAGSLTVSGSGKMSAQIGRSTENRQIVQEMQVVMVEHLGIEPSSACLQSMPADPARAPLSWCLEMGSNHRRAPLQDAALPLSYPGEVCEFAQMRKLKMVRTPGVEPGLRVWHTGRLP